MPIKMYAVLAGQIPIRCNRKTEKFIGEMFANASEYDSFVTTLLGDVTVFLYGELNDAKRAKNILGSDGVFITDSIHEITINPLD